MTTRPESLKYLDKIKYIFVIASVAERNDAISRFSLKSNSLAIV
jgi:hypothetical protein